MQVWAKLHCVLLLSQFEFVAHESLTSEEAFFPLNFAITKAYFDEK